VVDVHEALTANAKMR
jgi:hypothetical protein